MASKETPVVQVAEPGTVAENCETEAVGARDPKVAADSWSEGDAAHTGGSPTATKGRSLTCEDAVTLEVVERLCHTGTAAETSERQSKALDSSGPKARRAQHARETLDILAAGSYISPGTGANVDISEALCKAVASSIHVAEAQWRKPAPVAGKHKLCLEVRCCTVLAAAQELATCAERLPTPPGVLNFASARNPGGGFTTGAEAQEESLARSSGIYPCLTKHFKGFFEPHRRAASGLYTHGLIHSPQVPVLRDEHGMLLDEPYFVDFVTAAAPNRGVLQGKIRKNGAHEAAEQCSEAFRERMRRVLHMFASNGCADIVLGAWGCGVFQNDPETVASLFDAALAEIPYFRRVIFAVLDPRMAQTFGEVLHVPVQGLGGRRDSGGKAKGKGGRQGKGEGSEEAAVQKSEPKPGGSGRKQKRWQKGHKGDKGDE